MSEHTGTIQGISVDYETDKMVLTLMLNEKQAAANMYQELKDMEKLDIKINKHKKKRSLDANAYAWVLMDKLAEKLHRAKTDIYKDYVKDIGGNSDVFCCMNKAVDKFRQNWEEKGIGWPTETEPSKHDGCTNVRVYYGSSTYDTAQMSRLIELIVNDCIDQGIDVRTPEEIAHMMTLWGERK